MSPVPSFAHTPINEVVHELAMPLIGRREDGDEFVAGTAFMIGPGWAVTAWHVVDEFFRRYDSPLGPGETKPSFKVLAYLRRRGGTGALPLVVRRVWRSPPLDLAVLAVTAADQADHGGWTIPQVALLPPRKGTEIFAFGFARGSVSRGPLGLPLVTIGGFTTTGRVEEVHHNQRDGTMLRFPCFQTSARFDHGMSGGPVFDRLSGQVCGVVCSSFSKAEDAEQLSYASALWPLLGMLTDATENEHRGGPKRPLVELYKRGVLRAADVDRVRVVEADGVVTVNPSYDRAAWNADPAERALLLTRDGRSPSILSARV